MKLGEVWYVDFPLEENPSKVIQRPVVVLAEMDNGSKIEVLSVKVTSHPARDEYDITIINYSQAGLRVQSVARTSKTMMLDKDCFMKKFGNLTEEDLESILVAYTKFITNKK